MREQILQKAAESIRIYGLKKFKLEYICQELKISKKTIYKYFESKDEIAESYIKDVLDTDRKSTDKIIKEDISLTEKCHKIIWTYHKYKVPSSILSEISMFYENEWKQLLDLKKYKLNAVIGFLEQSKRKGEIKNDIDLSIVALMIESVSDKLMDSETLKENNLKYNYAVDEVIQIILKGIIKQ